MCKIENQNCNFVPKIPYLQGGQRFLPKGECKGIERKSHVFLGLILINLQDIERIAKC